MLLSVIAIILYYVRDAWWFNTLWAYPAGIFYSTYKDQIQSFANLHYKLVLFSLVFICTCLYLFPIEAHGFKTNILSVFFAFLIVVLSMRIKIHNRALEWCGENLFPLYIYQRIPMMIFAIVLPSSFLVQYPLAYIGICLVVTIGLVYLYKFIKIAL